MADQYQRSITSGRSLSDTEDEDAITPAPITTSAIDPIPCQPCCSRESSSAEPTPRSLQREGRRPHSGGSWRKRVRRSDLTEDEDVDTERLWRRMLDIQRMFGCYNSARMSAALALSGGDEDEVSRLRPTKTCLDLLNDSITQLPDDSRRQLEGYLYGTGRGKRPRGSWKRRTIFVPA